MIIVKNMNKALHYGKLRLGISTKVDLPDEIDGERWIYYNEGPVKKFIAAYNMARISDNDNGELPFLEVVFDDSREELSMFKEFRDRPRRRIM